MVTFGPGIQGGGGTVPTVSPRRMTTDDVSHTMELSGGGGAQLVPSSVSTVWIEETMAGDTSGRECPHDDFGIRPQTGTDVGELVTDTNIGLRYGGGALSFSGVAGSPLPVNFPVVPVLPVEGPQLGSLQVAVVRVDGTPAVVTSGWKCPRDERNRRWPSDASLLHGGPGSLWGGGGEMLASRKLLEVSFQLCHLGALFWLVAPLARVRCRLQISMGVWIC